MSGSTLVRAENLGHRFPGTPMLFEDLSFTLVSGRITGLCGPSGCGKSTLLSLLAGWEEPVTGSVTTEGVERVGWVFQNPYGVPGRSALDHVVLPLIARGQRRASAEETAMAVMADFRLDTLADRSFRQLSGGEAQRLMLARAVCASPDLLLVDDGRRDAGNLLVRALGFEPDAREFQGLGDPWVLGWRPGRHDRSNAVGEHQYKSGHRRARRSHHSSSRLVPHQLTDLPSAVATASQYHQIHVVEVARAGAVA